MTHPLRVLGQGCSGPVASGLLSAAGQKGQLWLPDAALLSQPWARTLAGLALAASHALLTSGNQGPEEIQLSLNESIDFVLEWLFTSYCFI